MITEQKEVIVENIALNGSAFGVTKEGENVFINARIVALLGIRIMDNIVAHVLPNYPNRKDQVPWRAVRVDKTETAVAPAALSVEPRLEDIILRHMKDGGIYSNAELSEDLEHDVLMVSNSTARLFAAGKLAKAEVYRRPGQARPSFLLYAINVEEFE
jgi:hypothetical protein